MIRLYQLIDNLPKEDYGIAIAICGKTPRASDLQILGIGLDVAAKLHIEHEARRKGSTFERQLESCIYAAIREHFEKHRSRF